MIRTIFLPTNTRPPHPIQWRRRPRSRGRRRDRSGPGSRTGCSFVHAMPDWCIYIEGHTEERATDKPRQSSGQGTLTLRHRLRPLHVLRICVEVCPFDALFWSPDYEYSEQSMGKMMHDKDRLQDWLTTVPKPPELA